VFPDKKLSQYFGIDGIKHQEGTISLTDFRVMAGPLTIPLLVMVILLITWKLPMTAKFKTYTGRN